MARNGRKKFLVIGLGNFGMSVAQSLTRMGHDVLGVDADAEVVEKAKEHVTHALQLDGTDVEALRSLSIPDFDFCVVGRGTDLADSILITMNLKELGAKFVAAKALSEVQGKILQRVGADEIVFPEWDMGRRFAQKLVAPNVMEHITLWGQYAVEEIRVPKTMVGRTLAQLDLRSKYQVNVLAVMKDGILVPLPGADDVIPEGGVLVVVGNEDSLRRLRNEFTV